MYFINHVIILYMVIVPVGIFSLSKGSLVYLHMLELAPQRLRGTLHTLSSISAGVFGIIAIGFFYLVPDSKLFLSVMGVFCFLHLIPVIRCPESPRFLFTQKRWNELHEALEIIAYSNNTKLETEIKFRGEIVDVNEDEPNEIISMMTALSDKIYFKNL
mmetsp:Transcript_22066/g.19632  ORF Transcript_22066/g.19632 Transcript_22066/m.19632 type:complete len:159 (-) Transcript_22066:612-1088(-)